MAMAKTTHAMAAVICVLSMAAATSVSADDNGAADGTPPNIVYILADDLGIGDVKCFGGDRCQIDTPHLDRMAREGMRFTDAHPVFSVCIPSRIAMMTGRYPWRFQRPSVNGPWGYLNPQFSTEQFTLGKMLRSAGYRTSYVGKWHLGTLMQTVDGENQGPTNVDYKKPITIGPPQFGFDESLILPGSLDMYPYAYVHNNAWVGQVTAQKGWSAFNRVGPAAEDFEDYEVLDTFSSRAEAFIAKSAAAAKAGQPFFLYLALTAPHTPISPSPPFEGKSKIGIYGDFVTETDHCVGRVLDALKAHGLDENTLVIATSDHGAGAYAGRNRKATPGQLIELEKEGHYSRGIYRGYKFSIYEGGVRVPFVARWPAVVKPGTACDRLVGLNDLMRTFAEICGRQLPDNIAPDSISFLPLLRDSAAPGARQSMILQSSNAYAVRQGDWKLALCPGSGCAGRLGNRPTREQAFKDALASFGKMPQRDDLRRAPFVQLFNLKKDPGESHNLAAEHPEKIDQLLALLDEQIAAGRSTPGPKLENDVPRVDYFGGSLRYARSLAPR